MSLNCFKTGRKQTGKISSEKQGRETDVKKIDHVSEPTTVTSPYKRENHDVHERSSHNSLPNHRPVMEEDNREQLKICRKKNERLQQQLIEINNQWERSERGASWSDMDNTTRDSFPDRIEGNRKRKGKLRDELKATKRQLKQCEDDLQSLREQLHRCSSERDDYRDRLGQLAAIQLTDNNPNIVDISDPNRSTKLAERFSELYDNQWSDAFEEITEHMAMTPEDAVQHLLDILRSIFETCKEKSRVQLDSLEEMIRSCICSKTLPNQFSTHMKLYKEERKKNYKMAITEIRHEVSQVLKHNLYKICGRGLGSYVEEATDICWLMCIQDPPMSLSFNCKKGDEFRKETFTVYTKAGKVVSYLVWPILQQYKDGPLISKGVAQCMKVEKRKKKTKTWAKSINKNNISTSRLTTELRKEGPKHVPELDRAEDRHSLPDMTIRSGSRIVNPDRLTRPHTSEGRPADGWRSLHVDVLSDIERKSCVPQGRNKRRVDVSVQEGLGNTQKWTGSLV